MVKKILIALLAAFIVYTFYFLWAQAQEEPVVYELVSPETGNIEKTVTATGKLEPRTEVSIKPKVTGVVASIEVSLGEHVKAGQLLATVQITPDQRALAQAKADADVAKVALDNAKQEYDRCASLFEKKVVSRRELEASESAYRQAQRSWQGCCDVLEVARKGFDGNSERITEVRSSIDGIVMEIPSKKGTAVVSTNDFSEGSTIVVVARMEDIVFKGSIDETDASSLSNGQVMHLTIGSMKDRTFDGQLESVSPRGKSQNGTIQFDLVATVQLPQDIEVRAGYSANAEFVTAASRNVMIIDEGCVEFDEGKSYVYCLASDPEKEEKQVFERREISLGISDGIRVEVKDGISIDDKLRGLVKK